MYKTSYLYPQTHARLTQLKNAGQIDSIMSFVDSAINKAIAELPAPPEPAKEIVITIKIEGGNTRE